VFALPDGAATSPSFLMHFIESTRQIKIQQISAKMAKKEKFVSFYDNTSRNN